MQLRELTFPNFEQRASELSLTLPIEQTAAWAALEETIPGRTQWGCFEVTDGEKTVALVSFADYQTHGYHYLRAHHAPVWVESPDAATEAEALDAIASYVRRRDRRQMFVRLSVDADLPVCEPVLSGVPYDQTVIVDLAGTDDDILARMKPRGRRDVRKALRESPITCADETERGAKDFSEYHDVMVETGERDGFIPAPASDYQDMLRILGPDRCRLMVGRSPEGRVANWSIVTISGARATRYYAASRNESMRQHVGDKLLYFECCELAARGCVDYDLMAIGSEFSPSLMGLNEFKTKFAKETAHVAPDRDLPLKRAPYGILQKIQSVRNARWERMEERVRQARANAPRENLLPVLLGGDVSTYAYAREFHEAYHVRSVAINQDFVAVIKHSSLFSELVYSNSIEPAELAEKIRALAEANPAKHLPVIASTDALVWALDAIRDELPANVVLPIPGHDALVRSADKVEFSRVCERLGLPTPKTVVASVSGPAPVPGFGFPVVAKPARSGEYSHLYAQGFKKVYALESQAALDELWADLARAGFAGDFLVQELIAGDDTHMGALTFYAGANSKLQAFGAAQTLLEDHAPTMRGNSVAMICRTEPELIESVQALVSELGYTGLGEVDVKRDPKTGQWLFLELNPRVGRNSYYMAAAGVNPMRAMVTDAIDKGGKRLFVADEPALYTLVPLSLVRRYVTDEALLAEVDELVRAGRVFDPQRYDADSSPVRLLNVELTERNQLRKFARHYPAPTETSF